MNVLERFGLRKKVDKQDVLPETVVSDINSKLAKTVDYRITYFYSQMNSHIPITSKVGECGENQLVLLKRIDRDEKILWLEATDIIDRALDAGDTLQLPLEKKDARVKKEELFETRRTSHFMNEYTNKWRSELEVSYRNNNWQISTTIVYEESKSRGLIPTDLRIYVSPIVTESDIEKMTNESYKRLQYTLSTLLNSSIDSRETKPFDLQTEGIFRELIHIQEIKMPIDIDQLMYNANDQMERIIPDGEFVSDYGVAPEDENVTRYYGVRGAKTRPLYKVKKFNNQIVISTIEREDVLREYFVKNEIFVSRNVFNFLTAQVASNEKTVDLTLNNAIKMLYPREGVIGRFRIERLILPLYMKVLQRVVPQAVYEEITEEMVLESTEPRFLSELHKLSFHFDSDFKANRIWVYGLDPRKANGSQFVLERVDK